MNLLCCAASKYLGLAALALVASGGIAWVGYAAARTWLPGVWHVEPAPTPVGVLPVADTEEPVTADPKVAKEKTNSDHPSVAAVRDRVLEQFHGRTTDLFTSIPGFGMERLIPLYKYVPFEAPYFSTGDVEVEKEIAPPKVLGEVFAKSLGEFQHPSKPMPPPKADHRFAFDGPRKDGFGGTFNGTVTRGLQLRLLDLVGLTDLDHPTVYAGGRAFEVMRMNAEEMKVARAKDPKAPFGAPSTPPARKADATEANGVAKLETRPLDFFETAGVIELSQAKDLYVRHKDNVIRMLGALRATETCIKCHSDNKQGDLLGAFSYTFVDTDKGVDKDFPKPK